MWVTKKRVAVLLAVALLGGRGKAHADHIVATFTGQVVTVTDPTNQFSDGIHPVSTFTAAITYDVNAAPYITLGTNHAWYHFLTSSLRVGDRVFEVDARHNPRYETFISLGNHDGTGGMAVFGELNPTLYGQTSYFVLSFPTRSAFQSLALPTSFEIEQGERNGFSVMLNREGINYAQAGGLLTSVDLQRVPTAQTPEPSTLALLATAGVGLFGILGRRRRPCSGSCPPRL